MRQLGCVLKTVGLHRTVAGRCWQSSNLINSSTCSGQLQHGLIHRAIHQKSINKYERVIIPQYYNRIDNKINSRKLHTKALRSAKHSPKIRAADDVVLEDMYYSFLEAVSMSRARISTRALDDAIRIWKDVFSVDSSIPDNIRDLQAKFINKKYQFVTFLTNHHRYDLYEALIKLNYNKHPAFNGISPTPAERQFSILQFQRFQNDNFEISMKVNEHKLSSYINDSNVTIENKRDILSVLLHKGLLYTPIEYHGYYIDTFFKELFALGDLHFDREVTLYDVYTKSFNLLLLEPNLLHDLETKYIANKQAFMNLLTILQNALIRAQQPKVAMDIWQLKIDRSKRNEYNGITCCTSRDLTQTMRATFNLRLFEDTLKLYRDWESLHDDDQIATLLRIAEKERNWAALQRQFESMYGRGTLPHKVHYGIVMNALASIGARDEVNLLFEQLLKRNFKPNTGIISALVNSNLFYNDIKEAGDVIDKWAPEDAEYLHSLMYQVFFQNNDLSSAMSWIERSMEVFNTTGKNTLISLHSIHILLRLSRKLFALKETERLWAIAKELKLVNQSTYVEMAKSYTKFDLHERCDEICIEARNNTTNPFRCGPLYAVELRNLRFWLKKVTSARTKELIKSFIDNIIASHTTDKILPERNWYAELIRYYISNSQLDKATEVLKFLKSTNARVLHESHFQPFMEHHLRQKTTSDSSEVLEIFKDLTANKVPVTVMSYERLMEALLFLDRANDTDYVNSTNLLMAVYDMNKLTFPGKTSNASVIPPRELIENSQSLSNITLSYIVESRDTRVSGNDLLLGFLDQLRSRGGNNITDPFKLSLYQKVYQYYIKQKNYDDAQLLIDNVLVDVQSTIQNYVNNFPIDLYPEYKDGGKVDIPIPKDLASKYEFYLMAKFDFILQNPKEKKSELVTLLKTCNEFPVKLSSFNLNRIIQQLLLLPNFIGFKDALAMSERYLIEGSWHRIALVKAKIFILRSLVVYQLTQMDRETVKQKYKIFMDLYNIKLERAEQQFKSFRNNPENILRESIQSYNLKFSKHNPLSMEQILEEGHIFFLPEVIRRHDYVLGFDTRSELVRQMKKYKRLHLKDGMFEIMDEFPETVEYSLLVSTIQRNEHTFLKTVDLLYPPGVSEERESLTSKRKRMLTAITALHDRDFNTLRTNFQR